MWSPCVPNFSQIGQYLKVDHKTAPKGTKTHYKSMTRPWPCHNQEPISQKLRNPSMRLCHQKIERSSDFHFHMQFINRSCQVTDLWRHYEPLQYQLNQSHERWPSSKLRGKHWSKWGWTDCMELQLTRTLLKVIGWGSGHLRSLASDNLGHRRCKGSLKTSRVSDQTRPSD